MKTATFLLLLAPAGLTADDRKGGKDEARKAFEGTWTIVDTKKEGTKKGEPVSAPTVEFDGDKYRIKAGDKVVEEGTFAVDATATPKRIEVTATAGEDKGMKWHGIYELEGDSLRAVVGPTDKDRPAKLDDPGPGTRSFTLKRAKPAKK